jgi:hypothetical protein
MTTRNPADLSLAALKGDGGIIEPEVGSADNSTGDVLGPLTAGRWALKASQDCYFTRGDDTLAGTDVKVDESTPDTDVPLFGGEVHEIVVEHGDSSYNHVGFRTAAGTALVWAIKVGDFARQ